MGKQNGPQVVRSWREKAGLSQRDVADRIGDPGGQFQRWESGNRPTLPIELKVRLARITGIDLSRIVSRDEREMLRELVAVLERDRAL